MENINTALQQFPEIEEAILFGSRAMGNYKKGSDIDLAIKGKKVTQRTLSRLQFLLEEELPIPYFFDVIDYQQIHSENLIQHITQQGVVMYRRRPD